MRRFSMAAISAMAGLAAVLEGCASAPISNDVIFEAVSRGQPVPDVSCLVRTVEGSAQITTPARLPVRNTAGDLRVVCDKPGFRTSEVIYRAGVYGGPASSVGLGVASGGSVGVGLGFGVPIGGAYRGSGVPERVVIEMNPL
ncbi:hypothetical protein [Noviherbaspirillum pedocola]|uniref:Lipoprotein n=1 Tax=Noviherbaspirillum pedocola TaxID=2801341 RepID=A0A934W5X1_9BURK|nr:hypothetical protein [Noviherbaspirillum pedocola]MBK4734440.1 hypothetical protein [Noviherbaspirillum pedocola]